MVYICCWSPNGLERISEYYHMSNSPNRVIESLRVSPWAKYGFEMKWERKVRGHVYYRQRYWKGKWEHGKD